jgi:dTMP kinase
MGLDIDRTGNGNGSHYLSAQHLSLMAAQQGQAEMQEQYMRNYMAMMAKPMMAQQAQYQWMLHQQQQQYHGRATSTTGVSGSGAGTRGSGATGSGPPLAAFMQPRSNTPVPAVHRSGTPIEPVHRSGTPMQPRERGASPQQRRQSGVGDASHGAHAAPERQPMLSMMMAAPPASSGASALAPHTYYPHYAYAQPLYPPAFYQHPTRSVPSPPLDASRRTPDRALADYALGQGTRSARS